MLANCIKPNGDCVRCGDEFGERADGLCASCGVHMNRIVKKKSGRRGIRRKRGRNSGKVGTSKK